MYCLIRHIELLQKNLQHTSATRPVETCSSSAHDNDLCPRTTRCPKTSARLGTTRYPKTSSKRQCHRTPQVPRGFSLGSHNLPQNWASALRHASAPSNTRAHPRAAPPTPSL
jgi:hypothetical protein